MTERPSRPLVLVDGSSYLYRAFHVPNLQRLTRPDGSPTGAIYGVINMLRKLRKDYQPTHMAVVFDAKGKTFRHERYEEYKANRPPMPEELRAQIEPLYSIIRAMGLPLIVEEGVEADDVIGTLATMAANEGENIVISTGDKDLAQLVSNSVSLVNTMTNSVMDPDGVRDKFGVSPEHIIDYLTLIGDTSDNIPGVPKVGPKTAAKWLQEYGSLDNILEHADEIKGKVGENLREFRPRIPLTRELVTIRRDLELEETPDSLAIRSEDSARLRELFTDLNFSKWLSELGDGAECTGAENPQTVQGNYEIILNQADLDRWLEHIRQAKTFAFDTETTSLDYMQARIVGVSFSVESGKAAYVPVAHDYEGAPQQLGRADVLEQLRPLLEDRRYQKIGHNLKYDMSVLANHGIELDGIAHDTMLESYVLDSTASRHDMDSLALKYLGHTNIRYEDVAGKGAKQVTFNQVDLERAGPYAAEDADITLRLHETFWPRLEGEAGLARVYSELEIPLVPVLSEMERTGVRVDVEMLGRQSGELAARMEEIEAQAFDEAGGPFNLGSPKQIQEILYDKLGLPVLARTPKGAPSTAETVLQDLAAMDETLPRLILDYRALSKLKSTYTDRLPEQVDPGTGRVHTSYHQAVAATGRLSSSDPNLQNIPVRTEEGRRIRQAFVAPEGRCILAADYSQIELRIMAHLSGDKGLLDAFAAGEDIHRATAAEVFGIRREDVSSEQRRSAKAINFGLIYGMSAFGLARQLGIERAAAQEYVNRYFARYPGVKTYMDDTRARAHDLGFVETVYGRRLYLPEINARNAQRRNAAERTAINAPMQGTAADIIKRAMIATHEWIGSAGHSVQMVMQVHDELVFEVAKGDLDAVSGPIREHMEKAANLTIPLVVDIGMGTNWDQAH